MQSPEELAALEAAGVPLVVEHDCSAGVTLYRPATADELAELATAATHLEVPAAVPLAERIADAAAAAIAAVLPELAPHADTAAVAELARGAALDALTPAAVDSSA